MPSSDYERALGLMLLTAGKLEMDAEPLAWTLIGVPYDLAAIITRRLTLSQTLDLAIRLIQERHQPFVADAKVLIGKAPLNSVTKY